MISGIPNLEELDEDDLSPSEILKQAGDIRAASILEEKRYIELLQEQMSRESESLRLYEPMPHQDELHRSSVRNVIMRKGNQVGGSLCAAVEVARAVTGQDPYNKYPKKNGIAACLAYGEGHIGRVFHGMLFNHGAFDIIKDIKTDKWRTYRPWPTAQGGDLERASERVPAPPLIPERYIDEIIWSKKGARVFELARFKTGWELYAFNSVGDPNQAQGFKCHLYWVDEDIATSGWISEITFRLLKHRGFLRWTALPHGKNDEMMNLIHKAEEQKELEDKDKDVKLITVSTLDNRYMDQESMKETVRAALAQGEDVYKQRILGVIDENSFLMYPAFSKRVHDINIDLEFASEAQKILVENDGIPPADWTRYAIADPGYTVMAILFVAIPPPDLGGEIFIFDECYMRNPAVPAKAFAEEMSARCTAHPYEEFIFDYHGGRLRSVATGELPIDIYSDELSKVGVKSLQTGSGFRAGCADIKRREEDTRRALSLQRNGRPTVQIVVGRCPNLCSELETFKKKKVRHGTKDVPVDEGNRRVRTHAVECLEMAVSSNLKYVPRKNTSLDASMVDIEAEADRKREINRAMTARANGMSSGISLGPGAK